MREVSTLKHLTCEGSEYIEASHMAVLDRVLFGTWIFGVKSITTIMLVLLSSNMNSITALNCSLTIVLHCIVFSVLSYIQFNGVK